MLCLFRYLHHNFIKNCLEMAGPKIYLLIQRLLIVCLRALPNMPTLRRLITRSKQMQLTLFSKSQFRILRCENSCKDNGEDFRKKSGFLYLDIEMAFTSHNRMRHGYCHSDLRALSRGYVQTGRRWRIQLKID